MGEGAGEVMDDQLDRGRDFTSDLSSDEMPDSDAGIEARDPDDPEIQAIVVGIEATRAEMSQTVDELGDRLDPANIADRAGSAVRDATIGKLETKVNDMSDTASEFASNAGQTAQDAGAGVIETIRRNPVPAALAAVGIGWLVLNRNDGRNGGRRYIDRSSAGRWSTPSGTTDDVRAWSSDWQDDARRRGERVGDAFDDATASARQAASDTFGTVQARAGSAADTVSSSASDALATAQQTIESNPLAFSAIAVAVGAAIGLALPATQAEKRVMGSAGGQLIDKVESAVSQPLQEMQQQSQQSQSSEGSMASTQ
jgi:ElaB/YqjD/DUF883 family membrane-anchored ribosome-binding protein